MYFVMNVELPPPNAADPQQSSQATQSAKQQQHQRTPSPPSSHPPPPSLVSLNSTGSSAVPLPSSSLPQNQSATSATPTFYRNFNQHTPSSIGGVPLRVVSQFGSIPANIIAASLNPRPTSQPQPVASGGGGNNGGSGANAAAGTDQANAKSKSEAAKQSIQLNKCLNEKRRREQENLYIEELAALLSSSGSPDEMNSSSTLSVKQDKCAILQETVKQIQNINQQNSADDLQASEVSSSRPSILPNDISHLLLDAINGFMFTLNSDGYIEFVSENVCKFLKYTQSELVNKSIYDIVHSDDRPLFSSVLLPMAALGNGLSSSWSSASSSSNNANNKSSSLMSSSSSTNCGTSSLNSQAQQQSLCNNVATSLMSSNHAANPNGGDRIGSPPNSRMFNSRFKIKPSLDHVIGDDGGLDGFLDGNEEDHDHLVGLGDDNEALASDADNMLKDDLDAVLEASNVDTSSTKDSLLKFQEASDRIKKATQRTHCLLQRRRIKDHEQQYESMNVSTHLMPDSNKAMDILSSYASNSNNSNATDRDGQHSGTGSRSGGEEMRMVCVARLPSGDHLMLHTSEYEQFNTRLDLSGKVLKVDNSNLSPHYAEYINESSMCDRVIQDFAHPEDFRIIDSHLKETIHSNSSLVTSKLYRFKLGKDRYCRVFTRSKIFKQPQSQIIVQTHAIRCEPKPSSASSSNNTSGTNTSTSTVTSMNSTMMSPPLNTPHNNMMFAPNGPPAHHSFSNTSSHNNSFSHTSTNPHWTPTNINIQSLHHQQQQQLTQMALAAQQQQAQQQQQQQNSNKNSNQLSSNISGNIAASSSSPSSTPLTALTTMAAPSSGSQGNNNNNNNYLIGSSPSAESADVDSMLNDMFGSDSNCWDTVPGLIEEPSTTADGVNSDYQMDSNQQQFQRQQEVIKLRNLLTSGNGEEPDSLSQPSSHSQNNSYQISLTPTSVGSRTPTTATSASGVALSSTTSSSDTILRELLDHEEENNVMACSSGSSTSTATTSSSSSSLIGNVSSFVELLGDSRSVKVAVKSSPLHPPSSSSSSGATSSSNSSSNEMLRQLLNDEIDNVGPSIGTSSACGTPGSFKLTNSSLGGPGLIHARKSSATSDVLAEHLLMKQEQQSPAATQSQSTSSLDLNSILSSNDNYDQQRGIKRKGSFDQDSMMVKQEPVDQNKRLSLSGLDHQQSPSMHMQQHHQSNLLNQLPTSAPTQHPPPPQQHNVLASSNPMLAKMLEKTSVPEEKIQIPSSIISSTPDVKLPPNLDKKILPTPSAAAAAAAASSSSAVTSQHQQTSMMQQRFVQSNVSQQQSSQHPPQQSQHQLPTSASGQFIAIKSSVGGNTGVPIQIRPNQQQIAIGNFQTRATLQQQQQAQQAQQQLQAQQQHQLLRHPQHAQHQHPQSNGGLGDLVQQQQQQPALSTGNIGLQPVTSMSVGQQLAHHQQQQFKLQQQLAQQGSGNTNFVSQNNIVIATGSNNGQNPVGLNQQATQQQLAARARLAMLPQKSAAGGGNMMVKQSQQTITLNVTQSGASGSLFMANNNSALNHGNSTNNVSPPQQMNIVTMQQQQQQQLNQHNLSSLQRQDSLLGLLDCDPDPALSQLLEDVIDMDSFDLLPNLTNSSSSPVSSSLIGASSTIVNAQSSSLQNASNQTAFGQTSLSALLSNASCANQQQLQQQQLRRPTDNDLFGLDSSESTLEERQMKIIEIQKQLMSFDPGVNNGGAMQPSSPNMFTRVNNVNGAPPNYQSSLAPPPYSSTFNNNTFQQPNRLASQTISIGPSNVNVSSTNLNQPPMQMQILHRNQMRQIIRPNGQQQQVLVSSIRMPKQGGPGQPGTNLPPNLMAQPGIPQQHKQQLFEHQRRLLLQQQQQEMVSQSQQPPDSQFSGLVPENINELLNSPRVPNAQITMKPRQQVSMSGQDGGLPQLSPRYATAVIGGGGGNGGGQMQMAQAPNSASILLPNSPASIPAGSTSSPSPGQMNVRTPLGHHMQQQQQIYASPQTPSNGSQPSFPSNRMSPFGATNNMVQQQGPNPSASPSPVPPMSPLVQHQMVASPASATSTLSWQQQASPAAQGSVTPTPGGAPRLSNVPSPAQVMSPSTPNPSQSGQIGGNGNVPNLVVSNQQKSNPMLNAQLSAGVPRFAYPNNRTIRLPNGQLAVSATPQVRQQQQQVQQLRPVQVSQAQFNAMQQQQQQQGQQFSNSVSSSNMHLMQQQQGQGQPVHVRSQLAPNQRLIQQGGRIAFLTQQQQQQPGGNQQQVVSSGVPSSPGGGGTFTNSGNNMNQQQKALMQQLINSNNNNQNTFVDESTGNIYMSSPNQGGVNQIQLISQQQQQSPVSQMDQMNNFGDGSFMMDQSGQSMNNGGAQSNNNGQFKNTSDFVKQELRTFVNYRTNMHQQQGQGMMSSGNGSGQNSMQMSVTNSTLMSSGGNGNNNMPQLQSSLATSSNSMDGLSAGLGLSSPMDSMEQLDFDAILDLGDFGTVMDNSSDGTLGGPMTPSNSIMSSGGNGGGPGSAGSSGTGQPLNRTNSMESQRSNEHNNQKSLLQRLLSE